MFQNLKKSFPRRVKVIITANRELTLDWEVQQAHMAIKVMCPQTFGHKMHMKKYFL